MRKLLLLSALCWCSVALAQTKPVDCNAVKSENTALKEKIVAYEARLGIGVGGVVVAGGNDNVKVSFLSCKASKTTRKAVFTFIIKNSDEPMRLAIWGQTTNGGGSATSSFFDEQGVGFPIENMFIGVTQVGYGSGHALVPSNTPVQCRIEIVNVPSTTKNLSTASLSFEKQIPGMNVGANFVTTVRNVPVTWVP